jgi:hypothetical protein
MPPSSSSFALVIDDETLEHCSRYTEQCLLKILHWQPLSFALKQEQLRMLQYQVYPSIVVASHTDYSDGCVLSCDTVSSAKGQATVLGTRHVVSVYR